MKDNYLIQVLILMLIAFREGFQQRDRITPSKALRNTWHVIGLGIRFLVFGMLINITLDEPVWIRIVYAASGVFLISIFYSISCAIGMKRKWYYVSDRGADWVIRKIFFFVDFDK